MSYDVRFYTGDYTTRQAQANRDNAVAYVEHHFNSAIDSSAGYSLVVVGSNASEKSQRWGRWYSAAVAKTFAVKDSGILIGGYRGRGDGNIRHTDMPAILLEPLFASNPTHAAIIRSAEGQRKLAEILAESIRVHFPNGGVIAFSVGHKGRTSKPLDRGAAVVGGGAEADYAEPIMKLAKAMLAQPAPVTTNVNACPTCGQTIPATM